MKANRLFLTTREDQFGPFSYDLEGTVDGTPVGFSSASLDRANAEAQFYIDSFKDVQIERATIFQPFN